MEPVYYILTPSFGVLPGDICDRNGCKGILYEKNNSSYNGCVCFMGHPPCSYCTSMIGCCPECEWNEENSIVRRAVLIEKIVKFKYRSHKK